jgi:hypothetical protein
MRMRSAPVFETDSGNETANEMYVNVLPVILQANGKKNQIYSYTKLQ